MACGHCYEEQCNGNWYVFVFLQPQAQQHAAHENNSDKDQFAIVSQYACQVLHIRRTVTVLIHHRFVCQHEVVVEKGI